jgi:hypothetical protein
MRRRTCGASGEARGGGGLGEETMAVNGRHLFAKVDKQVSELKERSFSEHHRRLAVCMRNAAGCRALGRS